MGGLRSGTGIKRPDHTKSLPEIIACIDGRYVAVRKSARDRHRKQIKHLPSLFSNKLDPSLHASKKERDRAAGIVETKMDIKNRKRVIAEARDIQNIARQFAPDAMQALIDILQDPEANATAKITAANVVLDRAYGKAAATNINMNTNMDAAPKDLDSRDLDIRIVETLNRIERATHGAAEEAESEERSAGIRKYN